MREGWRPQIARFGGTSGSSGKKIRPVRPGIEPAIASRRATRVTLSGSDRCFERGRSNIGQPRAGHSQRPPVIDRPAHLRSAIRVAGRRSTAMSPVGRQAAPSKAYRPIPTPSAANP